MQAFVVVLIASRWWHACMAGRECMQCSPQTWRYPGHLMSGLRPTNSAKIKLHNDYKLSEGSGDLVSVKLITKKNSGYFLTLPFELESSQKIAHHILHARADERWMNKTRLYVPRYCGRGGQKNLVFFIDLIRPVETIFFYSIYVSAQKNV